MPHGTNSHVSSSALEHSSTGMHLTPGDVLSAHFGDVS